MTEVFEVGKHIVNNAKAKLGNRIDIIVFHGSQIKGTATDRSDLDLHYVPNTATSAHLTVLFEDKCFDLHPVSWERERARAEYDDMRTSTIVFSRVVYARTPETLRRYNALKERVVELQKPEYRPYMIKKATSIFKKACYPKYLLDSVDANDLISARVVSWELIEILIHSLAVLNQTFLKGPIGENLEEITGLRISPSDTAPCISVMIESTDVRQIQQTATGLMTEVRALLLEALENIENRSTLVDMFTAYYPEIKEQLHKIEIACDQRDLVSAARACTKIQSEVARFLSASIGRGMISMFNTYSEYALAYENAGLPNLIMHIGKADFETLREKVCEFDNGIKKLLSDNGIGLNIVVTVEELKNALWNRD